MKTAPAPFVRNPYNYDTNKAGDESGLDTGKEGGAKQSFREECDINTIVKRFGLGHELPQSVRVPRYGDFTNINDYHAALNQVTAAQSAFNELPAHLRARFNNDPGQYVDFCIDENNQAELAELGLLSKEALERIQKAKDELEHQHETVDTSPGATTAKSASKGEDKQPTPRK